MIEWYYLLLGVPIGMLMFILGVIYGRDETRQVMAANARTMGDNCRRLADAEPDPLLKSDHYARRSAFLYMAAYMGGKKTWGDES